MAQVHETLFRPLLFGVTIEIENFAKKLSLKLFFTYFKATQQQQLNL
jgi:hypothetical protein